MASRSAGPNQPPLVVIVGETGSGKTALAIALAKRLGGEIICADSRTVYKGMDIGTAKPTAAQRRAIKHYGLDVVGPGEGFSAYHFQQLAYRAIDEIWGRGKLSIMVGGTGLYIDAVLYNFQFRRVAAAGERARLQELSVEALQQEVMAAGYDLPANDTNPRHLTRLLESGPPPCQARQLRSNTVVLGLRPDRQDLENLLRKRVEAMFAAGLVDEVRGLLARYDDPEAFKAPGYKAVAGYLSGQVDLAEAKRQFVRDDLRLAKRQRTWFRRNPDIHWLTNRDNLDETVALITTILTR